MEKVVQINKVIKEFFEKNKNVKEIRAKELMPEFIKAGIFNSNNKDGRPIRDELRKLDHLKQLDLIPYVFADRKEKNTNWYFCNKK